MCPAANQARPGEGAPGVGQAVGERGVSVGGSAEAPTAARLPRAATPLGRREDLRLDLPQPQDGQGPREAVLHGRGVRLRGHDAPHGQADGVRLTFRPGPGVGDALYPGVVPL
jgi:hypothetical protein